MTSHPIPHDEWRRTLDEFSLAHFAWPVSVEIVSPAVGAQPTVLELPLDGISVTGAEPYPSIAISMSREQPEHVTHMIEHVRHVLVRRQDNVDNAIEIVAADGTRTILRFSPPATRVVSRTIH